MQFWHMLKIMVYKVLETSHWTIFHDTVGHFRLIANKDITWECGFYFGYNNVHVKYGNFAFPKCQEYFLIKICIWSTHCQCFLEQSQYWSILLFKAHFMFQLMLGLCVSLVIYRIDHKDFPSKENI